MQVKVLDAFSFLQQDNFKEAAARFAKISISDEVALTELVRP